MAAGALKSTDGVREPGVPGGVLSEEIHWWLAMAANKVMMCVQYMWRTECGEHAARVGHHTGDGGQRDPCVEHGGVLQREREVACCKKVEKTLAGARKCARVQHLGGCMGC